MADDKETKPESKETPADADKKEEDQSASKEGANGDAPKKEEAKEPSDSKEEVGRHVLNQHFEFGLKELKAMGNQYHNII